MVRHICLHIAVDATLPADMMPLRCRDAVDGYAAAATLALLFVTNSAAYTAC